MKEGVALDISLDSVVLKRMRQFAQVRRGGSFEPSCWGLTHAARRASAAQGLRLGQGHSGHRVQHITTPLHAPIDSLVQMNKLKKMALMVVGQSLAPDELAGKPQHLPSQAPLSSLSPTRFEGHRSPWQRQTWQASRRTCVRGLGELMFVKNGINFRNPIHPPAATTPQASRSCSSPLIRTAAAPSRWRK